MTDYSVIDYSDDVPQYQDSITSTINSIKEDLYEFISADSTSAKLDYITDIIEALRQIDINTTYLANSLKEVLKAEEKDA